VVDTLDSRSAKLDPISPGEKIISSEKIGKDRHDQDGGRELPARMAKIKPANTDSVEPEEELNNYGHDETQGRIINIKV
jgi:hypothetical protein